MRNVYSLRLVIRSFSTLKNLRTSTKKPSYFHHPGEIPLTWLTIGQLIDKAADRWGDREAVVSMHEGQRLNFSQVKERVDKLAAGLRSLGLHRGETIGLLGPNSTDWYLAFLAAAKAGLIVVNINPAFQSKELQYCVNKVGIKALISAQEFKTQDYFKIVESLVPELENSSHELNSKNVPSLKWIFFMGNKKRNGSLLLDEIMDNATDQMVNDIYVLQDEIQCDDGFNIQFTSGTTGQPKGTLLSHHNIVNNSLFIGRRIGLNNQYHRLCLQVPLFHCFGCVIGVLTSLHYGSTIVMPGPNFKPKDSIVAIEEERCTLLYGTPTMYVDMLNSEAINEHDVSSAEIAVNGGAACSEQLFLKMLEKFKLSRVSSVFGMTETSPVSFQSLPGDSMKHMTSTVGHIMDHVEAKVVDREGRMVPLGERGELWIRGYCNMLGYWNDKEKTEEIFTSDRWLKTGDEIILGEDGYGQVVGRIKDMIIRGGENIFPREIEDFLQTHPSILEAQVFGIPDQRMGEEVCCWLRLKDGKHITEEEVKQFCKGQIAHYKIPRYVHFADEFPKTLSGKIQKFRMRETMIELLKL